MNSENLKFSGYILLIIGWFLLGIKFLTGIKILALIATFIFLASIVLQVIALFKIDD